MIGSEPLHDDAAGQRVRVRESLNEFSFAGEESLFPVFDINEVIVHLFILKKILKCHALVQGQNLAV